MNDRERLIIKLHELDIGMNAGSRQSDILSDFILARDKKIVEPLVKYKNTCKGSWGDFNCDFSIDETLKNAGITE